MRESSLSLCGRDTPPYFFTLSISPLSPSFRDILLVASSLILTAEQSKNGENGSEIQKNVTI
jgi:hypothetical protein